ncbi:MAG: TfoX/Sxy family protein [Gammaproteobacteria bacterium]|nr:TfoX/Sxy family protein [Gammaproteobacteria bacterium]
MSRPHPDREFVAHLVDLMQGVGPVASRRMFGGHGLFLGGLMFGLIADGTLYLKADDDSAPLFTTQGLDAFTYHKQGRAYRMSYYQAPEDCLEDVDAMRLWANRAYEAALRAAAHQR